MARAEMGRQLSPAMGWTAAVEYGQNGLLRRRRSCGWSRRGWRRTGAGARRWVAADRGGGSCLGRSDAVAAKMVEAWALARF